MKLIKKSVALLAIAIFGFVAFVPAGNALALDPLAGACADNGDTEVCQSQDDDATSLIGIIVNTLLFIVGLISVIMIIWGGIRYATSAGNTSSVTAAKNTIVYAVVGLIIALLAFAIVNWVLNLF